jgi:GH25 family lysozyme M1 (1,4-beta-N-acetylmuramidase)
MGERPRLRFWSWHSTYDASDYGQVWIRANGGAWTELTAPISGNTGGSWTLRFVDLTEYDGQTVQIAFRFVSNNDGGTDAGWYVDDLSLVTGPQPEFSVTNPNDSGPGSLRQALMVANASPGLDTIVFAIPGIGPHTVALSSPLPAILDPVIIDGYTQPGSASNTLANGNNAILRIELNGSAAGINASGLYIAAGGCTVRGLVINRFRGNGVFIAGTGANGNLIQGNFIGTDVSGTVALSNLWHGVEITSSAKSNMVGGIIASVANLVSGNQLSGVFINGAGANGNLVQGNLIGTDATGTNALPNYYGVVVGNGSAASNTIGGTNSGARNIISGNLIDGVYVGEGATGNAVQGNYVGADVTGKVRLPNGGIGISITNAPNNVIGGSSLNIGTPPGNVISGNNADGIRITSSSGTSVQGNLVGTDAAGENALGNAGNGVFLTGNISGTNRIFSNVISANFGNGLAVDTSDGTTYYGPVIIGTDVTATRNLGNRGHGIFAVAPGTLRLSKAGEGPKGPTQLGDLNKGRTIIAFNGGNGAAITTPSNYRWDLSGSSIFSNTLLGIDLGNNGVTANDPCDADIGPNNLQNFPVLTTAVSTGGEIAIAGSLNSLANATFLLEFFANTQCDASGYGEGQFFLGYKFVTNAGNCTANFQTTFPVSVPAGHFITARATKQNPDSFGETSEFSRCIPLSLPPPLITSVSPNPVTGSASRQTITINGANFVNTPSLTLTWTGQPGYTLPDAQVTFVSSAQLQMSITTTTTPDTWTVKVTNPDGQSSGQFNFSVVAPPSYAITTSASPPVGGATSGGGTFAAGQSVTVVASPTPGYTFVNWSESGNQVSTSASYTFTASANRNLVANFQVAPPPPSITGVSPNPVTGLNSRQTITISGANFANKPTLTLTWTGQSGYTVPDAQSTFVTSAQLQMSITTTTTPDTWTVKVTNPDGQSSGQFTFTVVAPVISTTDGFDYPIGARRRYSEANDGDGWYVATEFNELTSAGYHLGEDWNAESGGDTDLGLPVYAASNGTIVFAGPATVSGWGNLLIIQHKLADGTLVETLYGHVGSFIRTSRNVNRGEQVATIGKPPPTTGNPNPLAHLHFEVRFSNCPSWGIEGNGYSPTPNATGWTDPSDFLDAHRPTASPTLSVTPTIASVSGTAGSAIFNVNNTGGGTMNYSSSITSGADWLSITSGGSGGNNGTISVSYAPNTGAQRSGTIVVTANEASGSPVTLTLTQAAATTARASGIDVFHGRGNIDWSRVFSAGERFAIIKATDGYRTSQSQPMFKDPNFSTYAPAAKQAGLMVGAYHFARPYMNAAKDEADFFVNVAGNYIGPGYLPPALDIEDPDDQLPDHPVSALGKPGLSEWIRQWCAQVESAKHVKPMLYMTPSFTRNLIEPDLIQYPLWIAYYETTPDVDPSSLGPWSSSWTFLQYSVQGHTLDNAVQYPPVDLDVFNGDLSALQRLAERYTLMLNPTPPAGGSITPNPPPDTDRNYAAGTVVMLTAKENETYFLQSWSGVDDPNANPTHVTMSGPRTVTATFTLRTPAADPSCGCPVQYLSQCYGGARISTQRSGATTRGIAKAGPEDAIDLALIRRFRDEVLVTTLQGQSIIDKFNKHSLEVLHHFLTDTNLQTVGKQAIVNLQPLMQDILSGSGDLIVSTNQINAVNALIGKLNEVAGVELKSAIQQQLDRVGGNFTNLTGKTSIETRRIFLGIPIRIVNPKITTNGGFEFTVTGEISGTLRVESSEDLIQWTTVDTGQSPPIFRDERPLSAKQRYYRVVSP